MKVAVGDWGSLCCVVPGKLVRLKRVCPRFFHSWKKTSSVSSVLHSMARPMAHTENDELIVETPIVRAVLERGRFHFELRNSVSSFSSSFFETHRTEKNASFVTTV